MNWFATAVAVVKKVKEAAESEFAKNLKNAYDVWGVGKEAIASTVLKQRVGELEKNRTYFQSRKTIKVLKEQMKMLEAGRQSSQYQNRGENSKYAVTTSSSVCVVQ